MKEGCDRFAGLKRYKSSVEENGEPSSILSNVALGLTVYWEYTNSAWWEITEAMMSSKCMKACDQFCRLEKSVTDPCDSGPREEAKSALHIYFVG
ncbi:hypothetical protein CEXT_590341 [Caerostris extrusa]|uniref:Uncharacterized protein n=1 Tax=Caerostris extrusa TaxID=172846 RepID=A0AAV4WPD0_CAEEX|nr:hypothetical protein CEXT_590341 [Caerostris extrusa]